MALSDYFEVIKISLNAGKANGHLTTKQKKWQRLANLAQTEAEKRSLLKRINQGR